MVSSCSSIDLDSFGKLGSYSHLSTISLHNVNGKYVFRDSLTLLLNRAFRCVHGILRTPFFHYHIIRELLQALVGEYNLQQLAFQLDSKLFYVDLNLAGLNE